MKKPKSKLEKMGWGKGAIEAAPSIFKPKKRKWYLVRYVTTIEPPKGGSIPTNLFPVGLNENEIVKDFRVYPVRYEED